MKTCKHCGTPLQEGSRLCVGCGSAVEIEGPVVPAAQADPEMQADGQTQMPEMEAPPSQAGKKKSSRKKVIAILCLAVFVIGLGAAAYLWASWYFSPEQKVLRLLKAGKYDNALEIVEDEQSLRRSDEFEEALLARLDTVKADFTQGTMEYAAVVSELDAIAQMEVKKVSEKLPEYREFVENLNTSRTNFVAAEKFLADGMYPEAIALYKQVIKDDSNYETARTRITEASQKYRQAALAEANTYAQGGSYTNAIAVLEAALEVLPGDTDLTSQKLLYEKDNLNQIKANVLDEAEAYAVSKDYESALAVLEKYTAEYGNDSQISVKYNEYQEAYVDSVLTEVDNYQQQEDYVAAIRLLQSGLTVAKDNTRLKNRLEAVTGAYEEAVCTQADTLVSQRKYDEAITLIQEALKAVPGNAVLEDKKAEIENKMPKSFLTVCKPYESSYYEEFANGRTFSMAGQEYTDGFKMRSDGYAIWNVNGSYTSLEFDLGHIDDTHMRTVTVELYLDGELYKTIKVNPESLPQHYSINLTGVKQLKIKTTDGTNSDPYIGMGNMIIE